MGEGQDRAPTAGATPPPRAVEAVVLAAGSGSRFGGGKLTAPARGGRLIDGALRAALAAPARQVWVVTGADAGVAGAARELAAREGGGDRLRLVHAADHAEGLSASLRAGVAALPRDADAMLLFLGDMPDAPHDVAWRLVAAWASTPEALAAAPVCDGRRGHPVLLSRALFPALEALRGDAGAGALLRDLGDRLALVPVADAGVLLDVDTPEALSALAEG